MKKLMLLTAVVSVSATALCSPSVTDVIVRQNWPWNAKINVDFLLDGVESGSSYDVSLKLYDGSTSLGAAPLDSLSGDTYALDRDDSYRIVLDPAKVPALSGVKAIASFRVEPVLTENTTANEILYKIVTIADGVCEDVTEGQIRKGQKGAFALDPVSTNGVAIKSVVWTEVTNDVYKTTKMAFRRVKAGTFNMGYSAADTVGRDTSREKPAFPVRLTQDFYIGVFPVTQRQLKEITGSYRSNSNFRQDREQRPQETISFNELRGEDAGSGWPTTEGVDEGSFVATAREKLKLPTLDLPTEAQWECACRAGTADAYNDGTVTAANKVEDAALNGLGRYKYNGGWYLDGSTWTAYKNDTATDAGKGTGAVGTYAPNAWGLYDMHGNVREYVLDWYAADYGVSAYLDAQGVAVDPKGPSSSANGRVLCGGSWNDEPGLSRSAYRSYGGATSKPTYAGFRLVIQPTAE